MAGKSRSGNAWKQAYVGYKAMGKYEKNRKRRLERHLKRFPGDEAAKKALSNISYRRATPKNELGWTYSAFRNVDKKHRSEEMVTSSQCKFWAFANKLRRKTDNEMLHLPKYLRENKQKDNKKKK